MPWLLASIAISRRRADSNAGDKFAANVSLVLVGNEVLYSRGVCSNGGAACTDSRDCGTGGSCNIGHYCSNHGRLARSAMSSRVCRPSARLRTQSIASSSGS